MDNLFSHKAVAAVQAIEAVGATVVYLPPYSPDLNPIENIFSKVKQLIRGLRPRSLKQIVEATLKVLQKITSDDLYAVFSHAGYAVL
jgi:transposase